MGIVAVLSLAGCDNGHSAFEKEFEAIKVEAFNQASPWDGYELLFRSRILWSNSCSNGCDEQFYKTLRSGDSDLLSLYRTALNEGDPRAYHRLFISDERRPTQEGWEERETMRQEYSAKLIALADSSGPLPAAAELQAIAGSVIADGRYAMLDYHRAIGYLHRGWSNGVKWAAGKASMAAEDSKNTVDAYLWALRCVGECSITRGHLQKLSNELHASTIIQVQQLAADTSVSTIGNYQVIK
jgi:hypothetical protein